MDHAHECELHSRGRKSLVAEEACEPGLERYQGILDDSDTEGTRRGG